MFQLIPLLDKISTFHLSQESSMFLINVLLAIIYISSAPVFGHVSDPDPVKNKEDTQKLVRCDVGDVIDNEKVKCVCGPNKIYKCSPAKYRPNRTDKDEKNHAQNGLDCYPKMVYTYDINTCICTTKGTWPHPKCDSIFKSLPPKSKQTCIPNSYIFVDCNVCHCNSKGEIDHDHCTKNDCEQNILEIRRSNTLDNVQGSCEPSTWYSLAHCQFCYCINKNKLVCSTAKNLRGNLLELGSYNLTICGKELINDVVELVPEYQKALRKGKMNENTQMPPTSFTGSTPMPTIKPRPMYASDVTVNPSVQAAVNSEVIGYSKTVGDNTDNEKDKDGYGSRSDESTNDTYKMAPREGVLMTQIPFDVDDDRNSDYVSAEKEISSDDGISIEKTIKREKPVKESSAHVSIKDNNRKKKRENQVHKSAMKRPSNLEKQDSNEILKKNIPDVLSQLLHMVLRKSMVKLESDTKCEPGSSLKENCNVCFCLISGKLLCTDKPC